MTIPASKIHGYLGPASYFMITKNDEVYAHIDGTNYRCGADLKKKVIDVAFGR